MGDPQAFSIRPASADDRTALVQLWQDIMHERATMDVRVRLAENASEHWSVQLQMWLGATDAQVLVADKQAKIIGFLVGTIQERPLYYYQQRLGLVEELAIDGHAHQGGVGTALLASITSWFKDQQVDLVESTVMHLHPMAQAFWRANGAAEVMTTFWYRLK